MNRALWEIERDRDDLHYHRVMAAIAAGRTSSRVRIGEIMTYRTNANIESGEAEHLKHIRELCDAKLASNDDTNALQFARDVLNYLGPAPPAFVDPPIPPSATGR